MKFRLGWLGVVSATLLVGCGGNTVPNSGYSPTSPGNSMDNSMRSVTNDPGRKTPDVGVNSLLNGLKPFTEKSSWYHAIDKSGVSSTSPKLIEKLGKDMTLDLAFGFSGKKEDKPYGTSYTVVPGDTVRTIVFVDGAKETKPEEVPLPTDAILDGKRQIVIDKDSVKLFEVRGAKKVGDKVTADFVGTWDLKSDKTGKVAELPWLVGLARYDDISTAKEFKHAFAVTLSSVGKEGAPTVGARLRLKKSYSEEKLSPSAKIFVKALKKYGMYVAGPGPDLQLNGIPDARWKDSELADLKKIKLSDFDFVK